MLGVQEVNSPLECTAVNLRFKLLILSPARDDRFVARDFNRGYNNAKRLCGVQSSWHKRIVYYRRNGNDF